MKPRSRNQILITVIAVSVLIAGFFTVPVIIRELGRRYIANAPDDHQKGLKEGISRALAHDCPVDLPLTATDIHYAYDLYWQGGCSASRYTYPTGDLKKQGEMHLRTPSAWKRLAGESTAIVPDHRVSSLVWFQPRLIATGWESHTSGILWEPKVWIDESNRYIYVLDQNQHVSARSFLS